MSDYALKDILPRTIEPRRFCQQGVVLRGHLSPESMPRLAESGAVFENVYAELHFSLDEQRERAVKGRVSFRTQVECQRCLESVAIDIDCDVSLAVVWDEEASRNLGSQYDPWIVSGDEADLYSLIEEEVLLGLPLVNYHEEPCGILAKQEEPEANKNSETEKQNPFQVLLQLKGTTKK